MKLRKAIFNDWEILLDWKNDPITRENSFDQGKVSEQTHKLWFNDSLINPCREIYILEDNSIPVGSIRINTILTDEYLLSWSIAPNQRGKGYGTKILKLLLQDRNGKFIAKIKPDNIPSIRMVQKNGFTQLNELKYVKQQ